MAEGRSWFLFVRNLREADDECFDLLSIGCFGLELTKGLGRDQKTQRPSWPVAVRGVCMCVGGE